MEQVGSGSRHKGEDAKPFYRNVTVIRNCDFLWNDGQRYMPTQSKLAQIRKSSVLGQYKKQFEFDQNMSKEMVMRKVEETFPYLRNKSYAFKIVTSRPPKCMPTSRIWDGEMIKRNTQGNSALYILEDEETRKNDSSAYLDQPKSKRRNDELTSLDQSQKAGCELSSLGIGTLAISGQEKQPTSSGSNTRNSASHRASASRLALKEFSTAETLGAENGTLQGFIRLPQNQQMNTSNELVVASQRSHQLSSAEAMETSQQFCSNETAREGLNLWSEDPHLSHVTSRPHSPPPDDDSNQETKVEQFWKGMTDSGNSQMADDNDHTVASLNINQPTSSESSAAVMDQNNTYPLNDFPMLDYTALLDIEMSDSLADNHSTTCGISGLDHNLSLDDLLPHEDEQYRISVEPEKVPLQMPQESPHETNDATNSLAPRTAEIREFQLPLQGSFLNSTEMSYSSADNHNTTSGISELNNNSSDDQSPAEDKQFVFSVTPKMVPLEGADLVLFKSDREFPEDVLCASASFEGLGTVDVGRVKNNELLGKWIPPAGKPGWVGILLKRPDGRELGETKIKYYDEDDEALKRVIKNPMLQARVFRNHADRLVDTATVSGGEAQHFGICGSTEPGQMLCALVYAAAEIGSQQFIEMIFKSSAGRVVFDFYRDRSPLPEAISREYGHEKTAIYLEEITKRFSAEASEAQNYPQTIDWSELVRAAEEAQKESGLSTEEDSSDAVKNTGYLGDIDTSSNESCESVSSESEDNIPLATSKGLLFTAAWVVFIAAKIAFTFTNILQYCK